MAARRPAPPDRPEPPEECNFFIDDSNIWIEAQKFAALGHKHMPKLVDGSHDPRLRIDVGRLVNVMLKQRVQGPSHFYGSRPSPNDAVWEAMEKYKFKTKIYDRSAAGPGRGRGREKEVDNSMGADMAQTSTRLEVLADMQPDIYASVKERTTFICISGDRDMMPPIKLGLEAGIRVELWAWNSSVSRDYLQLQGAMKKEAAKTGGRPLFTISFTNFYTTRSGGIEPAKTVVLLDFMPGWIGDDGEADGEIEDLQDPEKAAERDSRRAAPASRTRSLLEKAVCDKLLLLGRVFYITRAPSTGGAAATVSDITLYIEFPRVDNIEELFPRLRKDFRGKATVLSWPQYNSQFKHPALPAITTRNLYAPLNADNAEVQEVKPLPEDEKEEEDDEGLDGSSGSLDDTQASPSNTATSQSDSPWQTVRRSNPAQGHRRSLRSTQPCPNGIRCGRRGDCGHRHTGEERRLFADLPQQNFKKWKTAPCRFDAIMCHRGKKCAFAHSQKETWCLRCRHEGHYTTDCRY
ncbi:hypothetical protein SEUCBS139899_001884 [Sporothrix eucalyptigena]|uniref:NYN domain-containing protein n=1 Tax=Sporothrix eucalyptigena TaxID=1812306 RepID=A0ABP0BZE0_9PEZI